MNMAAMREYYVGCLGAVERLTDLLLPLGYAPVFADDDFSLFVNATEDGEVTNHSWYDGFVLLQGAIHSGAGVSGQNASAEGIAEQYLRVGESLLDSVDGGYSLVLWDSEQRKLFLSRDDYGTRLLYYFQDPKGNVWFSNNLNELLKVVGQQPISSKGFFEFLRFLDISPPYTIYEDIFFLEPEKILIAEQGRGVCLQEKKINTNNPEGQMDWEHTVDSFEQLLKESVSARLGQSEKIGAFLSGGIDSSLILAVAASLRKDIDAITVGFGDTKYDESPVARKIADHLGVRHQVMSFSQEEDYSAFQRFVSSIPSPFSDPAIIPTFQCFERLGSDYGVILDGTGADTLSGIMPARHIHFILNFSRQLPHVIRMGIAKSLNLTPLGRRHSDLFDFDDPAELLIRWKGWSRREISALCGQQCDLSHTMFYQIFLNNPDKTPYEIYSMLMGALPDDRIHQSAAIWGTKVGFPFFDRKTQSFVRDLPLSFRYEEKKPKKLFRTLLEKYVPTEIWDVPKHGFDYPFEELMLCRNAELVRDNLSLSRLDEHGLFDTAMVQSMTEKFLAGDHSVKFKVWALVVFQAWYKNYYNLLGNGIFAP